MFAPRPTRAFAAPVLAGIATLGLGAPTAALADEGQAEEADQVEMSEGEEKLAELLEGRVAGEPQNCINTRPSGLQLTVIADTAYVYGRGNTIYVQRTIDPSSIGRNDVIVTQRFSGTRLCRLDFANSIDRITGFFTGPVQFDYFVPYTRVESDG
ncbi:hypothetical protein [Erythrobacter sp.]|jgi:hypothetical protein|uniref:hypothetical protein n=1 Tax=Erythrobacter sp. TaxID=1042 RepID=UPI002ECDAD18|nr:hypothetical protein [Erythrobacter sp.]